MRVHDLARVAGIALADRDDHQVVKDGLDRQMDVDQFRDGHLHRGQKDALDGLAHPRVFHGRLADDGRGVDGVLAMRDAGEMEDRVLVLERVEAGVVAEGAFGAQLAQLDVAFENDFRVGRNFKVDGLAFDNLNGLAAQESCDQKLFDLGRRGHDGREGRRWIGADGHGDFKPRAFQLSERNLWRAVERSAGNADCAASGLGHDCNARALRVEGRISGGLGRITQGFAIVLGSDLLSLPVHARGLAVVNLHAIHADVALARSRIARVHAWQGDETAAIVRPAFEDREIVEIELLAPDHLLARRVLGAHSFGKGTGERAELRKHL